VEIELLRKPFDDRVLEARMTSIDPRSLEERARQLVDRVARECDENTLGSATVAIYDTAWVSMVARDKRWIFPESFQYLLDSQSADGGWKSGSTLQDDFLSTLASLFAIVRHSRATYQNSHGNLPDLEIRASKAKSYLESTMRLWELEEPLQVGFEILVPNILSMLENEQIFFDFPGREPLEKLKKSKMKGFDPEIFYSMPNSLLHSLEGLVGRIAFDRLGHHKTFGSMMASPASTAAYLIYSPIWDLESEQYLRSVVANGAGKGTGGVPSVFPIPIFESTWVRSHVYRCIHGRS